MFVCLCNGFTERAVEAAVAAGSRSVAQVYRALDCRPQCGKCVPTVRAMVGSAGCPAEPSAPGGDD